MDTWNLSWYGHCKNILIWKQKNKSIWAITVCSINKLLFIKDLGTSFMLKLIHNVSLLDLVFEYVHFFLPWKRRVCKIYPKACTLLILFLSFLYIGHWQIATYPNYTGINWNILLCGKCCAAKLTWLKTCDDYVWFSLNFGTWLFLM